MKIKIFLFVKIFLLLIKHFVTCQRYKNRTKKLTFKKKYDYGNITKNPKRTFYTRIKSRN